ncbi:hypothetical protein FB451DRAFT_1173064 [Mycena latifolia]|nr:hypothetical protein FB451DRAFT_1173064 [Mycena latifolia]
MPPTCRTCREFKGIRSASRDEERHTGVRQAWHVEHENGKIANEMTGKGRNANIYHQMQTRDLPKTYITTKWKDSRSVARGQLNWYIPKRNSCRRPVEATPAIARKSDAGHDAQGHRWLDWAQRAGGSTYIHTYVHAAGPKKKEARAHPRETGREYGGWVAICGTIGGGGKRREGQWYDAVCDEERRVLVGRSAYSGDHTPAPTTRRSAPLTGSDSAEGQERERSAPAEEHAANHSSSHSTGPATGSGA